MNFCGMCGTRLSPGVRFCENCGASIDKKSSIDSQQTLKQVNEISRGQTEASDERNYGPLIGGILVLLSCFLNWTDRESGFQTFANHNEYFIVPLSAVSIVGIFLFFRYKNWMQSAWPWILSPALLGMFMVVLRFTQFVWVSDDANLVVSYDKFNLEPGWGYWLSEVGFLISIGTTFLIPLKKGPHQ